MIFNRLFWLTLVGGLCFTTTTFAQFQTKYYSNKKIKFEGCITVSDSLRNGPWRFYYPNGKLNAEGSYYFGRMHGEWRYYFYENGAFEKVENWNKGMQVGDYLEYYPTGRLHKSGTFKNGVYDGMYVSYHPNGKIKYRGSYQSGFPHGVWQTFNENGIITEEATYENGILNGVFKAFNAKGIVSYQVTYQKGEPLNDAVELDAKGNPLKSKPDKRKKPLIENP